MNVLYTSSHSHIYNLDRSKLLAAYPVLVSENIVYIVSIVYMCIYLYLFFFLFFICKIRD